jgi:hypothetical protein
MIQLTSYVQQRMVRTTTGSANNEVFFIECFIGHNGEDIPHDGNQTANFRDCISTCTNITDCVDVSWANGPCYLKSSLAAAEKNYNIWSAKLTILPSGSTAGLLPPSTSTTNHFIPGITRAPGWLYQGCLHDDNVNRALGTRLDAASGMNQELCLTLASSSSYSLAGDEFGTGWWAANTIAFASENTLLPTNILRNILFWKPCGVLRWWRCHQLLDLYWIHGIVYDTISINVYNRSTID